MKLIQAVDSSSARFESQAERSEFVYVCQAYRVEPLISGDYTNIPPVQLHRYDSKHTGYSEAKPSKTGATGKWGGLFRVGFTKQKAEEETGDKSTGSNGEETMDEDDVVIVHNAASADCTAGRNC